MKFLRQTQFLLILSLAAFTIGACSPSSALSEEEEIATMVAQTQTAAAPGLESPESSDQLATDVPPGTVAGDLQPLSPEECEQLAGFMINRMFIPPVEQREIAVERLGETGYGCQAIGIGDGNMFPDMMVLEDAMGGILGELGWTEDRSAPACLGTGGWGPGASSSCYFQADALCELFIHVDPINKELCSDDEPITACFAQLQPDLILYTAELTCARDISPSPKALESDLMRIEFEPGAIRAYALGEVAAGGFDHYMLYAIEGQEMTVNLLDRADESISPDIATLVIWGAEGTVLVSSHADALFWSGELPISQDYFIDVKSNGDKPEPYTLEIIIPPAQTDSSVEYRNTEFGFGVYLPGSWEGFSILIDNWQGSNSQGTAVAQGPLISIHHPASTAQQPRQDIPIMVFTFKQWEQLQRVEWNVSAAPIGPSELGRNSHYVFALPPRYNYAYLEGWEEVEQILQGDPLVTFEPTVVP